MGEGRSSTWKHHKKITNSMLKKRMTKYVVPQEDKILAVNPSRFVGSNVGEELGFTAKYSQ